MLLYCNRLYVLNIDLALLTTNSNLDSFILETYIAPLQETTTQRRNLAIGVVCIQTIRCAVHIYVAPLQHNSSDVLQM